MKPRPLSGWCTVVKGSYSRPLVLRLKDSGPEESDHDAALLNPSNAQLQFPEGHFQHAILFGDAVSSDGMRTPTILRLDDRLSYLSAGDVIAVRDGRARVLFQRSSSHAWLLTTERCNNFCLMCSQPPKRADDSWLMDDIRAAIRLLPRTIPSLGFTGGEPLLLGTSFIDLLKDVTATLPDTYVHVLSNGRAFAQATIAQSWAAIDNVRLSVGIPLYAGVAHIHDYVVQARGAFDETVLGIMRLKDVGQRVEVRVVLHKVTAERLVQTCTWIARNLPFVDHVALMGLENTGFAIANENELWIDPIEYRDKLAEAVRLMTDLGVKVSIFNLPLCLLDETVRPYAVKSISEWKNDFPPVCERCDAKTDCAGFFSSGRPRLSKALTPIVGNA